MKHLPNSLIALFLALLVNANAEKPSSPDPDNSGYPRPLLLRGNWLKLNGSWDLSSAPKSDHPPKSWERTVTVPLSEPIIADCLWFRRTIETPTLKPEEIVVLHFDSVGWSTTLWVNGNLIDIHQGSHAPYRCDITELLTKTPTQEIVILTEPEPNSAPPPSATPITGILGTVWLETIPQSHILNLTITPDLENAEATIHVGIWGQANYRALEIIALDGEIPIAKTTVYYNYKDGGFQSVLKIPEPKPWTPDSPKLYGLRIRIANDDQSTHDDITSYFAFRKASLINDASGHPRLALNGVPTLLLGYNDPSDHQLSSDAQIRDHIHSIKSMGFNSVRFPNGLASSRFYHWADRLGLIVWQELPGFAPADPAHPQLPEIRDQFIDHPSILLWPHFFQKPDKSTHEPFRFSPSEADPAELRVVSPSSPAPPGTAFAFTTAEPSQLESAVKNGLSAAFIAQLPTSASDIEATRALHKTLLAIPTPK